MRRVFTHLTSGWQTTPFIHAKRFSWKTRIVPLWSSSKQQVEQKVCAPGTPQKTSSDLVICIIYILLYFLFLTKLHSTKLRTTGTRPRTTQKRRSHAPGQSRMRQAWNHALTQARLRLVVVGASFFLASSSLDPGRHVPSAVLLWD